MRRPHALDLQVRRRRPAAAERRARPRARLPGVRDPDGPRRRRDRDRARARRDLHLLRRHDARARLATARCWRPRRRAPTCGWSTRRSTRCGSPRPTRTARSSSSRSGSRRRRPSTALTLQRAPRPRASPNFLVHLQPRHDRAAAAGAARVARPAARRLHRPRPRRDGRRRRGRSSSSPPHYGKPVVVSGFEPLDILQSVLMILRQLARGPAARSRTSTSASSPTRATCARSR